jgi:hypothetical protein
MLEVRGRQRGQAGGLRVRTGKGQNQEDEKKKRLGKPGAERKMLVALANKTNCHRQIENTGINTQGISGEDG